MKYVFYDKKIRLLRLCKPICRILKIKNVQIFTCCFLTFKNVTFCHFSKMSHFLLESILSGTLSRTQGPYIIKK